MRILFRIILILLIGILSLSSTPLVQAAPLVISDEYSSNQNSKQDEFLKEECFSKMGVEGLKRCKNLIVQDQFNSEAWNQLGRIYYELENYQEAYLSFRYATSLRTDYAIAWANTCAALSQLRNYEQALNACNRSLSFSSASKTSIDEEVLAWNNKAIVLYFLGRYQESLEALNEVLSLKPDDSQAKFNRIVVLHALVYAASTKNDDFT